MKTKEKILAASMHLFNAQGVENVTVRDIAKEIGISHGNLCYHFANIDEIVFRLYENLVAELDLMIEKVSVKDISLAMLFETTHYIFTIFFKYRFLMIDFVNVMRKIEKIKQHYQLLMSRRRMEFGLVIQNLIAQGIFKPELFENQYQDTISLFMIYADFWIGHAEIFSPEKTEEEKINHYLKIYFHGAAFYLTEKGFADFQSVLATK